MSDIEFMDGANCASVDPDLFFPEVGRSVRQPISVCTNCDVIAQCLEYAQNRVIDYGVWGGLDPLGRRKLRIAARDTAA